MSTYLSINNLSKSYNIHNVLNGVSLILNAGERVGLVGANGVGKSTLLKIVAGEIEADGGEIVLAPGTQIGYLPQVITGFDDKTVEDLIDDALRTLRDMERQMRLLEAQMGQVSGAALDEVMATYGDLAEQFERSGGYEIDHRLQTVLNGLRMNHIGRDRRFGTLSGGEKARLGLALLLLGSPDVLLLDEPTNHLDFASLVWLEDYLQNYRGSILMVSHDRHFLNRTVNAIVEIDEQTRAAKRYSGGYDTYQQAKLQERRKWEADYATQQEEIKALQLEAKETARSNANYRPQTDNDKFIRNAKKATHDNTVAKRIRLAEEKLIRIEANPLPPPPVPLHFDPHFDPAALRGRFPITVSNIAKSYGTRCILDHLNFTVGAESRIVLAGPNGAGKSTLIKILSGIEKADSGEVYINPAVRLGYLDQEKGFLDPTQNLFEAFKENLVTTMPEQQLKTFLIKSGLFRYEDFEKPVSGLSSGQRRKLQIARLMAGSANLLMLDEPTNDVSFDVLEGLESALKDFPGPVIAASHDRRFMEHFGGEIWAVENGHIVKYLGGYEEYMNASAAQIA